MSYIGDFRLGDTLDCKFTTVSTIGAPTTLAGTPVISAYPGNSTTQLTAGITLTVDFDAVTGLHNVRVVATSGNGYATATNYQLVITTGTVGGTSVVGYVVGEFSIENRSSLMPTVAARTLDVTATGGAGVDWANVEAPTTAVALTGTTIATTQKVDINTIKTNPVVNAGTVTFPTTATLASTTNITAGTITTTTNLTTNNDKTGYSLAATGLDAITQAATGMVEIAKAVWDRVLTSATHNISTSAGRRLRQIGAMTQTDASVNDAAATTTSFKTTLTEVDNFWNDSLIIFTSGALLGQSKSVTSYVNVNGVITLDEAVTSAPANGDTFTLVSTHTHSKSQIANAIWQDTTAGDFTVAGSIGKSIMNGVTLGTGLTVAITSNIKKNQALSAFEFLMTDSTNHAPATLKTVSVTRSIDGAAFAAGTLSAVTEVGNGVYAVNFGAGDLNGNVVLLRATATGCDDTFERIVTQP